MDENTLKLKLSSLQIQSAGVQNQNNKCVTAPNTFGAHCIFCSENMATMSCVCLVGRWWNILLINRKLDTNVLTMFSFNVSRTLYLKFGEHGNQVLGKIYLTLKEWSLANIYCTSQEHSYIPLKGTFSKVVGMFVVSWVPCSIITHHLLAHTHSKLQNTQSLDPTYVPYRRNVRSLQVCPLPIVPTGSPDQLLPGQPKKWVQ